MRINEKTKLILLLVLGILILILLFSYAYFNSVIDNKKTTSIHGITKTVDQFIITQGTPISLELDQDNFSEGEGNISASTKIKINLIANSNTNSASQKYYVYFYIGKNEFDYSTDEEIPEIILTIKDPAENVITSVNDLRYITEPDVSGFDITAEEGAILISDEYMISTTSSTTGKEEEWEAIVTIRNMDFQQLNLIGNELSGQFIISSEEKDVFGAGEVILANNKGVDFINIKTTPNFTSIASTNEGLFKTFDDYGNSYYFRGAVDNNWVYFAGFYWRVVRITGDGSIKLIYSGAVVPNYNQAVVLTGVNTKIESSVFNNSNAATEYVGYMYELGVHKGHLTNSIIKNYIDDWYEENLVNYKDYISDTMYCNDRSMYMGNYFDTPISYTGIPSTGRWEYGARNRIFIANEPTLLCPYQEDAFTVDDIIFGNGALTYPIGLITADEVVYAGGITGSDNINYYLYTARDFWTLSPYYTEKSVGSFRVDDQGRLGTTGTPVTNIRDIRPVISIKSNVNITGTGYYDNPYEFSL